jgi:protease I
MASPQLQGQTVAFLVAQEGIEEVELRKPWEAIENAGGKPELVAPKTGEVQAFNHLDKGSTYPVDKPLDDADPDSFDALVLPGGVANPDQLRTDARAIKFVRAIFSAGKPVGVICHGPWTLVEADLVRARKLTSWPSLQTDIRNAGGEWVDQEVVVDQGLVSSRKPEDLPAFCAKIVEEFAEGHHEVASAGATGGGA